MKKILSILSVLIIILTLFTSCNSVSEPPVVPSETSSPSETVDIKPTEKPTESETSALTEPLYRVDSENNLLAGTISIDDYNNYQKFISEVNLPDHFIKYEDIASLGNFKRFYVNPIDFYILTGELLSYNYEIELEDGFSFRLALSLPRMDLEDVLDRTPNEKLPEAEINFRNMRNLKKNDYKDYSGTFIEYNCSNVTYQYSRETGTLIGITFCEGNYFFDIRMSEKYSLKNYPDAPDTLVGKLLNIEDNDPAEIVASITKNIKAE